MTDMGPPLQSPGRTPRRTDPGVDGRHRASLMIVLLGICGHLAATASVVLAVMGLMRLFDLLADRLQDPALAGIVTGLAAVLLIAAVGMLGLAAVRHQRTFSARMIAALDRHEGLRRARIRLGFALAVGVRAVLLLGAASLPVTALAISPQRGDRLRLACARLSDPGAAGGRARASRPGPPACAAGPRAPGDLRPALTAKLPGRARPPCVDHGVLTHVGLDSRGLEGLWARQRRVRRR